MISYCKVKLTFLYLAPCPCSCCWSGSVPPPLLSTAGDSREIVTTGETIFAAGQRTWLLVLKICLRKWLMALMQSLVLEEAVAVSPEVSDGKDGKQVRVCFFFLLCLVLQISATSRPLRKLCNLLQEEKEPSRLPQHTSKGYQDKEQREPRLVGKQLER